MYLCGKTAELEAPRAPLRSEREEGIPPQRPPSHFFSRLFACLPACLLALLPWCRFFETLTRSLLQVAAMGPAMTFLDPSQLERPLLLRPLEPGGPPPPPVDVAALNASVAAVLQRQLASGRQLGVVVVVRRCRVAPLPRAAAAALVRENTSCMR